VLQCRDAQDQIVSCCRRKLDDILIDDSRRNLVVIDYVVVDRDIVREHIVDLKNARILMAKPDVPEDRNLYAALVFPRLVIEVMEAG